MTKPVGANWKAQNRGRKASLDRLENEADEHVYGGDTPGPLTQALIVECFDDDDDHEDWGDLWLLLDDAAEEYFHDPMAWLAAHGYDDGRQQHLARPIEDDE